jgi:DNA-binding SARP family transcriptional activator
LSLLDAHGTERRPRSISFDAVIDVVERELRVSILVTDLPFQMLAYLSCRGGWVVRDELAEWLWPDRTQSIAGSNLRKVLRTRSAATAVLDAQTFASAGVLAAVVAQQMRHVAKNETGERAAGRRANRAPRASDRTARVVR